MQDALEADFKEESFFLKAHLEPDQLLIMAASLQSGFKEKDVLLDHSIENPFLRALMDLCQCLWHQLHRVYLSK